MLLIGKRGYEIFADQLAALGYEPVALKALEGLNEIVADHADTLICDLFEPVVMPRIVFENLPEGTAWRLMGRLVLTSDTPRGNYPDDVCLNALIVGDRLFGRLQSLSDDLKSLAAKRGMKLVNLRQGYAKCAAISLHGGVITADKGLSDALRRENIEALLIPPGHIRLDGCDYGFIGGASFVDEKRRRAVFFGSLPDVFSDEVRNFCRRLGYEPIELSGELTDVGGAIAFNL